MEKKSPFDLPMNTPEEATIYAAFSVLCDLKRTPDRILKKYTTEGEDRANFEFYLEGENSLHFWSRKTALLLAEYLGYNEAEAVVNFGVFRK